MSPTSSTPVVVVGGEAAARQRLSRMWRRELCASPARFGSMCAPFLVLALDSEARFTLFCLVLTGGTFFFREPCAMVTGVVAGSFGG